MTDALLWQYKWVDQSPGGGTLSRWQTSQSRAFKFSATSILVLSSQLFSVYDGFLNWVWFRNKLQRLVCSAKRRMSQFDELEDYFDINLQGLQNPKTGLMRLASSLSSKSPTNFNWMQRWLTFWGPYSSFRLYKVIIFRIYLIVGYFKVILTIILSKSIEIPIHHFTNTTPIVCMNDVVFLPTLRVKGKDCAEWFARYGCQI